MGSKRLVGKGATLLKSMVITIVATGNGGGVGAGLGAVDPPLWLSLQ